MRDQNHTDHSRSIVAILAYFDIFNYPLKSNEIFCFLGIKHTDENNIKNESVLLRDKGLIFQFGEFFTLQNNENNIARRIKGNSEAEKYLKLAKQKARLISKFPFVEAVMASGSLSKGYMDENSDIDFFIITKPGRLWITRTLLASYKKIFLFNSHKHFCLNYYLQATHLEIEEKNLFTAMELATIIPLQGAGYYQKLLQANQWLGEFFPNYRPRTLEGVPVFNSSVSKKMIEKILNILGGDWLDVLLMKIYSNHWKRLYQYSLPAEDFPVAFKTKREVSKSHPNHYQKKILELYAKKMDELKSKIVIIQ